MHSFLGHFQGETTRCGVVSRRAYTGSLGRSFGTFSHAAAFDATPLIEPCFYSPCDVINLIANAILYV